MNLFETVLLSVTQGITELLPISSSGHLILLGKVVNIDTNTFLLTLLHFGTTFALVLFFWKKLFANLFTKKKILFYAKIVVASIPSALTGFLFEDYISEKLRMPWVIAVSLIVWGIAMIIADRVDKEDGVKDVEDVSWKQSILIGIAQSIALIPGTSRSGVSTIAGVFAGLNKYTALEYSFILGLPVLFGSGLYETYKYVKVVGLNALVTPMDILNGALFILIPFVVSLACLFILKRFKKSEWLSFFGIYRIIIGVLILLFL